MEDVCFTFKRKILRVTEGFAQVVEVLSLFFTGCGQFL